MAVRPQALGAAQAARLQSALPLLGSDPAAALRVAEAVLSQSPSSPDALQFLALCLAGTGRETDAEAAFERALALAPGHPGLLVNFATLQRRQGRHERALELLLRAVHASPGFAQGWVDAGLVALTLGKAHQAIELLMKAVGLRPEAVSAWLGLASAYRAVDQLPRAEAALRRALALAPGHVPALLNLGAVLRLLGRSDQALECFDQAKRAGHHGPELEDARAGVLLDAGRLQESLSVARNLVDAHPGYAPGHETLADLLWEYGDARRPEDDPDAMFRQALHQRPSDRALLLAYARFLMKSRQGEPALVRIRELRAMGDSPVLAALEADALELCGRTDDAALLYGRLRAVLAPTEPAFLNSYARHALRRGQPELAASLSQQATTIDPVNQEAWANLSTAWRLLDDPREAWLCDYDRHVALLEVEPPPGSGDMASFLSRLMATLEPMHQARREPIQQSLRGGSQTPGRLFGRADPVIDATRKSLLRAIEGWLAGLQPDESHPFLARWGASVRFCGSWSVRLWSSGRHVNHIHPEGWMSSAFYVCLPPSVGGAIEPADRSGYIQFGQPPDELGLDLAPRRVIRPRAGHLALFPSYFWHGTVPFRDECPRVTIAFDMLPVASVP